MTSLVANRRALRVAQEPLDAFRRYMSTYAREQARCLYSPALIDNLERNWNAHHPSRRPPRGGGEWEPPQGLRQPARRPRE